MVFAATLTTAVDQITKGLALSHLKDAIQMAPFLSLTLSLNKGISFGMFNHPNSQQMVFVVISLCVIGYLILTIKPDKLSVTATSLIVGGAIGNVIDRVKLGAVVDFIHLHYRGYHFPIFNIADIGVCIGCSLLIIADLSHKTKIDTKKAEH